MIYVEVAVIKMDKYYHFTSYENLESINEYGLIPKSGGRTRSIGDNRCAIFLSQGIQNAILMYCSILYHYNCHSGDLGPKAIEFYKDEIKYYNELAKRIPLDDEDIAEVKAIKKAIEWINQIMEYKDFFEYMGDGVYLSVSNIGDISSSDASDCYTTKSIAAEKVKVVLLKNKETGETIDSRESVLAFFMSVTPIKNIIDSTPNVVTKKIIRDLYEDKLADIEYYNANNFELEEIPIGLYLSNNKKHTETFKKR